MTGDGLVTELMSVFVVLTSGISDSIVVPLNGIGIVVSYLEKIPSKRVLLCHSRSFKP